MVTAISRMAYQAEFDLLDQAIESERGVQRIFPGRRKGRGEAMNFRVRLHAARDYDRRENKKIYPEGDPLHGQTVFAQLTVKNPYWDEDKGAWVLQVAKNQVGEMIIEDIPPVEEEVDRDEQPGLEEMRRL